MVCFTVSPDCEQYWVIFTCFCTPVKKLYPQYMVGPDTKHTILCIMKGFFRNFVPKKTVRVVIRKPYVFLTSGNKGAVIVIAARIFIISPGINGYMPSVRACGYAKE